MKLIYIIHHSSVTCINFKTSANQLWGKEQSFSSIAVLVLIIFLIFTDLVYQNSRLNSVNFKSYKAVYFKIS